jgi:outer membrane receptor protein involved in Fe transport
MRLRLVVAFAFLLSCAAAQNGPAPSSPEATVPAVRESIEVTATRVPEDPAKVPAAIQVFDRDELAARGASDLRSALAFAVGVEIAPGGDQGPASSVPDFWGLKELDAFLLVVDGVPWGGAFNPALTTLSLADISRIEVLRGPAPVTYGATSFVGVIHVVHNDASFQERDLQLHGGSYGSGGGAFSTAIPLAGHWVSRLTTEGERVGFSDERTSYRRGHGLWRASRGAAESNRIWFNADLDWLDQNPASPRPRVDTTLSSLVPVDSNQNMAAAFVNEHRGTLMGGIDHHVFASGRWSTTVSVSPARQDIFRGFLVAVEDVPNNAHGFREKIDLTDVYADSHLSWTPHRAVTLLLGGDYLHGTGNARGADFDYTVPLSGAFAPVIAAPADLDFHIDDDRNFFGAYSNVEWRPVQRLRIDAGIRLNVTHEHQRVIDAGAGTSEEQSRTDVRPGASVGAIVTAWQRNEDSLALFANYRDTFKPAALDFGIGESEGGDLILKPETSRSIEGGLKGRFFRRRMEAEASGFLMQFENLVVPSNVAGVPGLINAGKERFQGFETEAAFFLPKNLMLRANYSLHDATFRNFLFNGTQLAGDRVEMSARNLAAVGIVYNPLRGIVGGITVNYTGGRYLDKRNTARAQGFASVDLGAGYRARRWELRVDVRNLTDQRDPVSESELGDVQYYLLPARRVEATFRWRM